MFIGTTIHSLLQEGGTLQRNLFKVPTDKAGNLFVKELSRLIDAYTFDSVLQSVSLRAAMVLPSLELQKLSKK